MNVCLADKSDALQISAIHQKELGKGFLSSLGVPFLQKFYEAIIGSKYSFCIVAKEGDVVDGFVSGVVDIGLFYKYFIYKYFFVLIPVFLPKIFSFTAVKKIIDNIFYPQKIKNLPAAELLTFAVKKEFQRQGVGSWLLKSFVDEMKIRRVKIFKVLVGKEMDSVKFYEKTGFQKIEEINLHNKESSIIFICKVI
ncbi:MAG: GNAT family N-acetyltransferase [Patescibacteria group bacterium]